MVTCKAQKTSSLKSILLTFHIGEDTRTKGRRKIERIKKRDPSYENRDRENSIPNLSNVAFILERRKD